MSLLAKKQHAKEFIVISIDSGSIGLAVINETIKEKVPLRTVLYKSRTEIVIPQSITMELYQQATLEALATSLDTLMTAKVPVPRDIHVILSSPWQSSQTRFVSVTKEKPFKVTHKTVHELMRTEETQFVQDAKGNPTLFGNDFVLFESKTMSATLNGYPIADPSGKSAKTLELTLHLAGASKDAMKKFSELIEHTIAHARVAFHSSVFSFFAELRDIFSEIRSFLVIEVSEMLSEIVIVESSALTQSVSFPGGLHMRTDYVAQALRKSEKEAAMYLRMYEEGTLDEALRERVSAACKQTIDAWAGMFGQAISSLSKETIIPEAIFLVSGSQGLGWVSDAIKSEVLLDYKISSQSFTFLTLSPEHFNDFIKTTGDAGHDVPLELAALYISTKL